jgi:flagellar basal body-associated protein FliL
MKSKLKIIVPVLLVAALGFGGYTFAFAGDPAPKPKVHGDVYVLGKEFVINLAEGRYAKMTVAIVKEPSHGEGGHGSGSTPPEGFGDEPQEALVRGIVTDVVSGRPASRLVSPAGRRKLQQAILKRLKADTDVHATRVVFTDVTVQ